MENTRKIILYPRHALKPIILTDMADQDIDSLCEKLSDVFKKDKIAKIETERDVLIIRPSEIQAMLITKNDMPSDNKKSTEDGKK